MTAPHRKSTPSFLKLRRRRSYLLLLLIICGALGFFAGLLLLDHLSSSVPNRQTFSTASSPAPHVAAPTPARGHGISAHPRPLRAYEEPSAMAVPALPIPHGQPLHGKPRIAIVIDDVGPDLRAAKQAITLPKAVTLAFLPYAEHLGTLTREAAAAGHELLVHVPMEPEDMAHNNPGPGALLTALPLPQVRQRLDAAIDAVPQAIGINNHMGSRFTEDEARMRVVLEELARRKLLFLDSRTTPRSAGPQLAREIGLRFIGRDVFLDNAINTRAIEKQLEVVEEKARRNGQAVAIGHPHRETLAALARWIPQALERGFVLVPISTLAAKQP